MLIIIVILATRCVLQVVFCEGYVSVDIWVGPYVREAITVELLNQVKDNNHKKAYLIVKPHLNYVVYDNKFSFQSELSSSSLSCQ